MAIEQLSNALIFMCFFQDVNGTAVTGVSAVVDVDRITNSSGTPALASLVTGGTVTELGRGYYGYVLASGSVGSEGEYVATFRTTNTNVRDRQLPSLWSVNVAGVEDLDATVSSRASSTQATNIQSDTDDIQTRLPSALVSGRIDASVGAMAANVLTAAAINDDAITAAKIAANAISSSEIADGAITAAKFATGAITATVIAADAIGASELATDAINEIADQVWDELLSGHVGAGSAGKALGDTKTDTTSIQADTDDIQTRIPAALVSGRIDASVGAMAANVVTATAIAADAIGASELALTAVDEIADAIWDELLSGHAVSGSTGEALTTVAAGGGVSVGAIADAVWDEALAAHQGAGSAGEALDGASSGGSGGSGTLTIQNLSLGGIPYKFFGSQHDQTLSGSVFELAIPALATAIMVWATGEDVYLTWDGDTPSSSVGLPIQTSQGYQILYLDPDRDDTMFQFLRSADGGVLHYQFLRPI